MYKLGRAQALRDLGLTKTAIDPVTAAGAAAAGKIWLSNIINRHGMHIPPIRRLAQEVAGIGLRTGQQGKPLLSRPVRELGAIGIDSSLMRAYEMGHSVGAGANQLQHSDPNLVNQLRRFVFDAKHSPELAELQHKITGSPDTRDYAKFVEGIPRESTGWRKVVDYGFTPVSQVGQDIKGLANRSMTSVKGVFKRPSGDAATAGYAASPPFTGLAAQQTPSPLPRAVKVRRPKPARPVKNMQTLSGSTLEPPGPTAV